MEQFSLEGYIKNPSRKVVTRNGRNVRIICTDKKGYDYPIVALIENKLEGYEGVLYYTKDGKIDNNDSNNADLFFAPEKHEGWLNIYHSESGFYLRGNPYKSKEEADEVAKANYKNFCATVKIEWEE